MRVFVQDAYSPEFGLQVLTLWSGEWAGTYEGRARETRKHDGYVVRMWDGRKVRVKCEAPRTDENWQRVDEAIRQAVQP